MKMMSNSSNPNPTMEEKASVPRKVWVILLINLILPTILIPVVFPSLGIVAATEIVDPSMIALLGVLTLLTSGAIIAWWFFLLHQMSKALSIKHVETATEEFLRYKNLFLTTYFIYVFVSALSPAVIVPLAELILGKTTNFIYYLQSSIMGGLQALLYYCVFFLVVDGILDEWGGEVVFHYQLNRLTKEMMKEGDSQHSIIAFSIRYKYLVPTFLAAVSYSIIMVVLFRNGIEKSHLLMQIFVFALFTSLLLATLYLQYRRMVIPIDSVLTNIKSLAAGDIIDLKTMALTTTNLDEVGESVLWFQYLINKIIHSTEELLYGSELIGNQAGEYQSSFESLLSTATEIARAMNEVSEDAEEISGVIQEIRESIRNYRTELVRYDEDMNTLHRSMRDLLKELRILSLNTFIELERSKNDAKGIESIIGVFTTLATEVQAITGTVSSLNEQVRQATEHFKTRITANFKVILDNVDQATGRIVSLSSRFEETMAAVEEETAMINELQEPTQRLVDLARTLEQIARRMGTIRDTKNTEMTMG